MEEQPKVEEKVEHIKQKKTIFLGLPRLKGKDKYETAENYSILFITAGVFILISGMILSGFNPLGLSAILAMLGTLIAFLSTAALVFVWFVKEFSSD